MERWLIRTEEKRYANFLVSFGHRPFSLACSHAFAGNFLNWQRMCEAHQCVGVAAVLPQQTCRLLAVEPVLGIWRQQLRPQDRVIVSK